MQKLAADQGLDGEFLNVTEKTDTVCFVLISFHCLVNLLYSEHR